MGKVFSVGRLPAARKCAYRQIAAPTKHIIICFNFYSLLDRKIALIGIPIKDIKDIYTLGEWARGITKQKEI